MIEVPFNINGRKHRLLAELRTNGRMYLAFGFNDELRAEIKASFKDTKFHGYDAVNPEKLWSFPINHRNTFRFNFYTGRQPYSVYKAASTIEFNPNRPLYPYQFDIASFELAKKQCIIGAEMGTGKTVSTMEALEFLQYPLVWWVAPRSALYSLELELEKWKCELNVVLMTYEGLVKRMKEWNKGDPAPPAVIFDESQRLKTPTAKRTLAAMHLADAVRDEYGRNGMIILLSGSPAPKSPVDWWSQSEIACPGYLREGHPQTFKQRLSLIKNETNAETGGMYPKTVTWWDDSNKCQLCGQYKEDQYHQTQFYFETGPYHEFKPSVDEITLLNKRLDGLVGVWRKRDVLKYLPEINYRIIECSPTPSILRAAQLITKMTDRAANALTLLRELSDGFQYEDIPTGSRECRACQGTKEIQDSIYTGPEIDTDADDFELPSPLNNPEYFQQTMVSCPACNGTGLETIYTQTPKFINTPKEQVLKDLLEEFDDSGRVTIWAGFHGAIDRVIEVCEKCNWQVIVVDGRGWRGNIPGVGRSDAKGMIKAFQDKEKFPQNIAFIGHPQSGGTGLTLTASPVAIYYSNDFNFDNRDQSIARGHRPGMDLNKGYTVIDIFHLPSDRYVHSNLQAKKRLQAISMGDLVTALSVDVSKLSKGYGVRA